MLYHWFRIIQLLIWGNSDIKYKQLIIRVLSLFIGLVIAHFGVTLFLLADLGSDPFNVFIQGLLRIITGRFSSPAITHGRVHMAVSFLIIIVLLLTDRSYIKIGTLICMFFGGPIIDFFTALLEPLDLAGASLAVRIIVNVCFAGLGFLMGGTLGIGTVICAFLVGTVAGIFMPISRRLVEWILMKFAPKDIT